MDRILKSHRKFHVLCFLERAYTHMRLLTQICDWSIARKDVRTICFESTSRTCFLRFCRWKILNRKTFTIYNVVHRTSIYTISCILGLCVCKENHSLFGSTCAVVSQSSQHKNDDSHWQFIRGWISCKGAWNRMRMYEWYKSKWWKLCFHSRIPLFCSASAVVVDWCCCYCFSVGFENTQAPKSIHTNTSKHECDRAAVE